MCLRRSGLALAFSGLTLAFSTGAEESGSALRTNPFLRPALSSSAPAPTEATGPARSTAPPSHLRFTLAAGPESLVNVDGRTLRIGEELNGYRLEAVRTDAALFSNGDEVIELKMQIRDIRNSK